MVSYNNTWRRRHCAVVLWSQKYFVDCALEIDSRLIEQYSSQCFVQSSVWWSIDVNELECYVARPDYIRNNQAGIGIHRGQLIGKELFETLLIWRRPHLWVKCWCCFQCFGSRVRLLLRRWADCERWTSRIDGPIKCSKGNVEKFELDDN